MDQEPCWNQKVSNSTWNASCRASVSPFLLGFEWRGEKYWENFHKHLFLSASDLLRNKVRVERQSASSKPNHQGSPPPSVFWINYLDNTHRTYNGETTLWQLQLTPKEVQVTVLSHLLFVLPAHPKTYNAKRSDPQECSARPVVVTLWSWKVLPLA